MSQQQQVLREAKQAERLEVAWLRSCRERVVSLERRLALTRLLGGGAGVFGTTGGEITMIAQELAGARRVVARAAADAASAGRVRAMVERCR